MWSLDLVTILIFVNRAYDQYTRGYNFSIGTTPKKFPFPSYGSSRFLAILGQSPIAIISALNFGPWSTKLGGTVGAIKTMTGNDIGPGPGLNYGERAVFRFGKKAFFCPKSVFFLEKNSFLAENHFLATFSYSKNHVRCHCGWFYWWPRQPHQVSLTMVQN